MFFDYLRPDLPSLQEVILWREINKELRSMPPEEAYRRLRGPTSSRAGRSILPFRDEGQAADATSRPDVPHPGPDALAAVFDQFVGVIRLMSEQDEGLVRFLAGRKAAGRKAAGRPADADAGPTTDEPVPTPTGPATDADRPPREGGKASRRRKPKSPGGGRKSLKKYNGDG